jgi:hypothetical protein
MNRDGHLAVGGVLAEVDAVADDLDAPDFLVRVRVFVFTVRREDVRVELDGDGAARDDDWWVWWCCPLGSP